MANDSEASRPVRILLIDDDPRERVLIQHTLEPARSGTRYEIDWAPDIDSGLGLRRGGVRCQAGRLPRRGGGRPGLRGASGIDRAHQAAERPPSTAMI